MTTTVPVLRCVVTVTVVRGDDLRTTAGATARPGAMAERGPRVDDMLRCSVLSRSAPNPSCPG